VIVVLVRVVVIVDIIVVVIVVVAVVVVEGISHVVHCEQHIAVVCKFD